MHCYATAGQKYKNELTKEEIFNIIDQLDEMSAQYIILSGGEPLIRPDFWNFAEYCKKKGIKAMVTTNGTLITDSIAKRLKESVESVQISFDSHIPEMHDEFRGMKGAFEKSLKALKNLKKHSVRVGIMSTLSKFNIEKLDEMIDYFAKFKVDGFASERFVSEGRGEQNKNIQLTPADLKKGLEILAEKRKEYPSIKISTNDPLYSFIDKDRFDLINVNLNTMGGCSAGLMACTITPDGYVTPCARFYTKFANIREKPLKEIWEHDPFLIDLRDRSKLKGKCGVCKYKFVCGGCRADAFHRLGDCHGEDSLCWINTQSEGKKDEPRS